MEKVILQRLHEIEEKENVHILLAVESGSRAWGFPSPDSDYDVRFLYIRPEEEYLRLDPKRDVLELPIDSLLDVNGWDLQKALRLLYKANPTLFEWFSSPIVYLETDFANRLRAIMNQYFSSVKSLYHYINMAEGNYRDHLKREMVKAKKYFYVLRPVLACQWILKKNSPPPMSFSELMEAQLPTELREDISRLLEIKMNTPEVKEIPRVDKINCYLDTSIAEIRGELEKRENFKNASWQELDQLFIDELRRQKF